MDPSKRVSVIVPAYNEERNIDAVLIRLLKVTKKLSCAEIIVVDDGSTDSTPKKVEHFKSVRLIKHNTNRGKGAAITTGLKNSNSNIFVIQDADMEYLPEDIPNLLEPILSGRADVVFGSRFKGKCNDMSFSHTLGNKILSTMTSLLCLVSVSDVMTGHKVFTREAIGSCDLSERSFAVEIEIASKTLNKKFKFVEVPIRYCYRKNGLSKISHLDGFKALYKIVKCSLLR